MGIGGRITLWRVVGVLLLGALLGAYFGGVLIGLIVGLMVALFWQLFNAFRLEDMLSKRRSVDVPDGEGVWPSIMAGISYQQERARRHKRLHRQLLKEVRQSTNAMPDGAILLNADHEILRYNKQARLLFGLRRRRDRGQRIDNLIRAPKFAQFLANTETAGAIDIPSPVDGKHVLSVRVVPYSNKNWLLLIRDVTEREQLNRMRRDFVANASHELRTPLTVLSGYLDALAEDVEQLPGWEKPISDMQFQAERMRNLLDDLMALSKLEHSATAPSEQAIDIAVLLDEAKALFREMAQQRSITLEVRSKAQLLGAPSEISSIVTNLLSNAIRYSAADGRISIVWKASEQGAVLEVSDNGIGIGEQDLPRVTERFFRVDRGRGRDNGGTGLGLAIVKYALSRHGATLSVVSTPDEGSCFTCHFPASRLKK